MTKLGVSLVLPLVLAACSSSDGGGDSGVSLDRPAVAQESAVGKGDTGGGKVDTSGGKGDQGGAKPEQPPLKSDAKSDAPTTSPGEPGAICTQQTKSCAAGLKCVFLDAWNAPKGTCVRIASGGCSSWDDPRCVVTGKNYSVMCGPYTEGSATTSICFLLCKLNGKSYDCPPQHSCKLVNGYDVCLPL